MAPVFGHGRLRLYLLKLLEESPRHGYELIRLLRDRFMGLYVPSAGTIYPRLQRLEAEGLVTVTEVAGRKVYRLSDAGREELLRRRDEVDRLEEEIRAALGDLRDTARDLRAEVDRTVMDLLSRPDRREPDNPRWDTFLSYLERRSAGRTDDTPLSPTEPDQPAGTAGGAGAVGVTDPADTADMAEVADGAGADTRIANGTGSTPGSPVGGATPVDTDTSVDVRAVASAFERRLQDFRDEVRDSVHDGVRDGELAAAQVQESDAILADALARIRVALGRQHR